MSNSKIHTLRKALNREEQVLFYTKEKVKNVEYRLETLMRHFDKGKDEHGKLYKSLSAKKEALHDEISTLEEKLEEKLKSYRDALKQLLPETDPSKHLDKLDSHFPILMLPLRLETRFICDENNVINKLGVRIFPDDCAIDSFEESLSLAEIQNAQNFWADLAAASGNEEKKRGAWRLLNESHGAGRAHYIINNYRPPDADDLLESTVEEETKVVLAVKVPFGSLSDAEKVPLCKYYEVVWKAEGNFADINQATQELENELGKNRTREVITQFEPVNFDDDFSQIENRDDVVLEVTFINFPNEEELQAGYQQRTWSKSPKVNVFPERFYLVAYRGDRIVVKKLGNTVPLPLICGPDPLAEDEELDDYLDGEIRLSPQMKWMVDFNDAVDKGLGFVITKKDDAQLEAGYDKLMVVGVRITADKEEGKELIEELFSHHYFGNSGFSFLRVGTPTNNLQEAPSGYTDKEDPDVSFDQLFLSRKDTLENEAKNWWSVSDKVWFNKLLGFSLDFLSGTANTDGYDQREARAMNTALWPATLGYFFESMMQPIFSEKDQEDIRNFFNFFVSGRGSIPGVRIDDQPYGILPTTAFSRIRWYENDSNPPYGIIDKKLGSTHSFYNRLYTFFLKMQEDWKNMAKEVPHMNMEGDRDQVLLDVLGHHGGSVEFHTRVGQSLNHLWNLYLLAQEQTNGVSAYEAANKYYSEFFKTYPGRILLYHDHEYKGKVPEILEKYFSDSVLEIDELIHDQLLSEITGIRPYTSDERNYIEWLIDAASKSFERLKGEKEGFIDQKKPNALLYTMLHHALETAYFETGLQLYHEAELISADDMEKLKADPDFINIKGYQEKYGTASTDHFSAKSIDAMSSSEKKYRLMEQKNSAVTGSNTLNVAQYITSKLKEVSWKSAYVNQQINALKHLKDTSSAALERLLVEHIDCSTYRFDAWKWGLINAQLMAIRKQDKIVSNNTSLSSDGLYIGAYAWLEDLRPDDRTLEKVTLNDNELKKAFGGADLPVLMKDSRNLGYIQAPSLNHAVTASVLRNAYLARADKNNPEIYNINLSSERVRKALAVLEGIQNGQTLAAVLGYQFERFLHDSTSAEVDYLIFPLRRQFPLVGDQMDSTRTGTEEYNNAPIEALEARNVINGSDLIDFVEDQLETSIEADYLDNFDLPNLNAAEKDILKSAVDHIRDTNDAVADLGLAESIHQVLQGNIDRAAGTLETYSKGNHPQVPHVIQTPRSGVQLTHRIGIQLNPKAAVPAGSTPRAKSEPAINEFLSDIFPDMQDIIFTVDISNDDLGIDTTGLKFSLHNLSLSPIDLLYLISDESENAMALLDELIVTYILDNHFVIAATNTKLRSDSSIKINYYIKEKDRKKEVSIFELMPLVRHMRAVLLKSRPLRPSDVSLPNETAESVDGNIDLNISRVAGAYSNMKLIYDDDADVNANPLLKLENDLKTLLDADILNDIIAAAENLSTDLLSTVKELAMYGVPQIGMSFIYNWKKVQMEALLKLAEKAKERFDEREQQYIALIAQINPGLTEGELMAILAKAELKISTTASINPDPNTFENDVTVVKKGAFDTAKQHVTDFIAAHHQSVQEALNSFSNNILASFDRFDRDTLKIEDVQKSFKILTKDLYTRVSILKKELAKRYKAYDDLKNRHDNSVSASEKAEIVQEIGKTLFSDDFKMIPAFDLLKTYKDEWTKAMQNKEELLKFLKEEQKNPLPVDDWFYGVSKVRDKISHFEQCVSLAEAFQEISIDLTPVQFPYLEPYGWLAMEFGHKEEKKKKQMVKNFTEHDHLLYTAYYHTAYSENDRQCGVLVDEWTEVIPTEEETTGTAFHYDRPNSEAPQSMLLVCSPQLDENWQWGDLIAALNETLEEAKLRGVEPEQIDKTGYSAFLPATLSAFTVLPVTSIANYATSSYSFQNLAKEQNNE
ncbi:MAG: hypothetical protein GY860_13895 [Desulfobacteraceae bacterium]|nr:hypothetical protein [Desulfobacteraceae bacterium]